MALTKIKLTNSNSSVLIEVIAPKIETDFIDVSKIVDQEIIPYFFIFPVDNLVSLLDFSKVIPYEILLFDDKREFMGRSFSLFTGKGSFRIQTRARYLLLWNRESLYYKEFGFFKCEGLRVGE